MTDAEKIEGLEARLLSLELSRLEGLREHGDPRRAFIRQAAIAIYAAAMSAGAAGCSDTTAWEAANALWAAKPEDC